MSIRIDGGIDPVTDEGVTIEGTPSTGKVGSGSDFAAGYKAALADEETSYIELMFDEDDATEEAKEDSKENKQAIKDAKKSVKSSAGDKKAQKKARRRAEQLDDFMFRGYSVKSAKADGNKVNLTYFLDDSSKKTAKGTIAYGKDGSKTVSMDFGNKTETKTTDSNGVLRQKVIVNKKTGTKTVVQFDENGHKNLRTVTKADNPDYKSTTYYDEAGCKSSTVTTDGKQTVTTNYKLDSDGKIIGTYVTTKNNETGEESKVYTLYDGDAKIETTKGTDGTLSTSLSFGHRGIYDEGNAANGQLDQGFRQGRKGDCWFLSALNGLNTNETGKKVLSEAIEKHADGSFTVHFKGVGASYDIPLDEIIENYGKNYATGDNDAFIFELAGEKLRTDIASGKVKVDESLKFIDTEKGKDPENAIRGGFSLEAIYAFTGVVGETQFMPNGDQIKEKLQKFLANPENTILDFSLPPGTFSAKTIEEGQDDFYSTQTVNHAFSIRRATENSVTIINPHDSTKEYTISLDDFIALGVGRINFMDLSSVAS